MTKITLNDRFNYGDRFVCEEPGSKSILHLVAAQTSAFHKPTLCPSAILYLSLEREQYRDIKYWARYRMRQ